MVLNTSYSKLIGSEANKQIKSNINDSIEALSGGTLTKFSDNASSLAIADNLRTEVTALNRSIRNGNLAAQLTQLADKAMEEQSNILDTIKQKLIQANTSTTSDEGRNILGKEIYKYLQQIDMIASETTFDERFPLQNSASDMGTTETMKFQLSDLSEETVDLISDNIQANTLGLKIDGLKNSLQSGILTKELSAQYQEKIDDAINILNTFRAEYSSTALQVESSVRSLMTQSTSYSEAESILRDIDYSTESANFKKNNMRLQGNGYAMSQANARQENILRALG